MLAARNDEKSSNDAVSSEVLLATMKAQQAVAIRFVGRRVIFWTCLFFVFGRVAAQPLTSLREVSLRRDGCAVVFSQVPAV